MGITRLDHEREQKLWFVRRKGRVEGPFPSEDIRRSVIGGSLSINDQVGSCRNEWKCLHEVPEVLPPVVRHVLSNRDTQALTPIRLKVARPAMQDAPQNLLEPGESKEVGPERGERISRQDVGQHQVKLDLIRNNRPPRFPLPALLLLGFGISIVMGSGLYIGAKPLPPDPECQHLASPGVNWRNCILTGLRSESADLRGSSLNNAVLRGARLSGSRLNQADLRYANLSGADLSYSNLQQANLKGAELRETDMSYADLSGADLSFARLTGANLGGANLEQVKFDQAIWIDGTICQTGSVGTCRTR
ncbi:MAG: pentapeptide repeat-containing protein [Gammaproteobacteria bacterium]|nr:pentapeptide repeat-containing protein [Gammaproteobacteria bacterium]